MSTSSRPDHYAQLQPHPRPWHLSQDEYLLVVRTLLDIPLGTISIPVAVGPYQKLSRLHCLRCDLFLASWPLLCLRCTEQYQFIIWHNVTQWFVECTFSLSSTNSLNWRWPISSTAFTVHIASLFMTTFVSRVSMSPLSSRNGFLMSSNVANREYTIV